MEAEQLALRKTGANVHTVNNLLHLIYYRCRIDDLDAARSKLEELRTLIIQSGRPEMPLIYDPELRDLFI
ncbi:hypothetical protein [Acinetobacter sp.]|uniref:hypothetical protein n=1 Tax=Acinetobacter sp. TaxID=472 RepID=UPI003CFF9561